MRRTVEWTGENGCIKYMENSALILIQTGHLTPDYKFP